MERNYISLSLASNASVVNYCSKSRYLASVDRKGSGKSKKAINEKQVILYVIFVRN